MACCTLLRVFAFTEKGKQEKVAVHRGVHVSVLCCFSKR